jgi:hypothetical protein
LDVIDFSVTVPVVFSMAGSSWRSRRRDAIRESARTALLGLGSGLDKAFPQDFPVATTISLNRNATFGGGALRIERKIGSDRSKRKSHA